MRNFPPLYLSVLGLLAMEAAPVMAQEREPADIAGSVAAKLDARGIQYEIDSDGDYRIVYSWRKESRSQLVFVSGSADTVGGIEVRQVFSPAARVGEDVLQGSLAPALLRDNGRRILGHWATNDSHLLYVIDVQDSIDAEALEAAINIAAEAADDKEIELTRDEDAF